MKNHSYYFLVRDGAVIALSILVAVILAKTGALAGLLETSGQWKALGSFVAGLFFTSIFTTAPAIVALSALAWSNSIWLVAFFGAIGAMLGDLLIFRFMRDQVSEHIADAIRERSGGRRFRSLIRRRLFRWLTFLAGGLIIASPLPDELGVALLGFTHTKTSRFLPLSFAFNFLGILLVGFLAKTF